MSLDRDAQITTSSRPRSGRRPAHAMVRGVRNRRLDTLIPWATGIVLAVTLLAAAIIVWGQ